jgi:hypothetical protein
MCEVEQMGSLKLGCDGNIVLNYDGMIWIYIGLIFRSKVAGSCWRWILIKSGIYMKTGNSVAAHDLSTIV